MSDIKNLLKDIKAYRNNMVARNYPFQEISNIITKWEMKIAELGDKKEDNDKRSRDH